MWSRMCCCHAVVGIVLVAGCRPEMAPVSQPNSQSDPTRAKQASAQGNSGAGALKTAQRFGMIIGVKEEQLEKYRQLHAHPWDSVLDQLDRSHIRNYSIWLVELRPGEHYLFGYLEYTGDNFDADMKAMGDDETTRKWWKVTDPCQIPIPTAREGQQWVMMQEVFYHDRDQRGAPLMPKPPAFEGGKAQ